MKFIRFAQRKMNEPRGICHICDSRGTVEWKIYAKHTGPYTISRAHIFLSSVCQRHGIDRENMMQMQKMTFFAPKNRPISIAQQQTLPRHFQFFYSIFWERARKYKMEKNYPGMGFCPSIDITHRINKND